MAMLIRPLLLTFLLIVLSLAACRKDKADPAPGTRTGISDSALYRLTTSQPLFYYKGKDSLLLAAGNSPHGAFKLRFNAKALSALDASGKLPAGAQFPDSSLVVKEFYNGSTLAGYAVMLKAPRDTNSGQRWVWGEHFADGTLVHSVKNKGQGCVHCHTQTPNRDFIRSFDLHP